MPCKACAATQCKVLDTRYNWKLKRIQNDYTCFAHACLQSYRATGTSASSNVI
jgi:adenylate cyclase